LLIGNIPSSVWLKVSFAEKRIEISQLLLLSLGAVPDSKFFC
jgi:hypothetical protein